MRSMESNHTSIRAGRGTIKGLTPGRCSCVSISFFPIERDDYARDVHLDVLQALRKVNIRIFGLQLNPNWYNPIADLKSYFSLLTAKQGIPLSQMLHIIHEYFEKWIHMKG